MSVKLAGKILLSRVASRRRRSALLACEAVRTGRDIGWVFAGVLIACGARSDPQLGDEAEVAVSLGGFGSLSGTGGKAAMVSGGSPSAGAGATQSPDMCGPAVCDVVGDWGFGGPPGGKCQTGAIRLSSDGKVFVRRGNSWNLTGSYSVCAERIVSPELEKAVRSIGACPASCGQTVGITSSFLCEGLSALVACNDKFKGFSLTLLPCSG